MRNIFDLSQGELTSNFAYLCSWIKTLSDSTSPIKPVWELSSNLEKEGMDLRTLEQIPESFLHEWESFLSDQVRAAAPYLPISYQEMYVKPLINSMAHLVRSHDDVRVVHDYSEILVGAVVQHFPDNPVRFPLRQFLAVVSNLYRSFLSPKKRGDARVPLSVPSLPPLGVFHHVASGNKRALPGPVAFTSTMNKLLCGADIAVMVLPIGFYRSPITWAPLAHEATGHSVLQADPQLLPDLVDGIRAMFGLSQISPGETLTREQSLGALWAYWAEEAASDVLGLLNIGPSFAISLAAILAANRSSDLSKPILAVQAGDDRGMVGPHPIDVLRIHIAIGVLDCLTGLSRKRKADYARLLRRIADFCAHNAYNQGYGSANKVRVKGRIPIHGDHSVQVDFELPISEATATARRVGGFIASFRVSALANKSIQDLETWDESDEDLAQSVCERLIDPVTVLRNGLYADGSPGNRFRVPFDQWVSTLIPTPSDARKTELLLALRGSRFSKLSKEELADFLSGGNVGPSMDVMRTLARVESDCVEALLVNETALQLMEPLEMNAIFGMGDDAQLVAGATLAALITPSSDSLRWINQRLAFALIKSFNRDKVVGAAEMHLLIDRVPSSVRTATFQPPDPSTHFDVHGFF
jgi:hypothetical protein